MRSLLSPPWRTTRSEGPRFESSVEELTSSTEEAGRGMATTRRTRLKDKRLKIKFIEFFILVA